MAPIGGDVLSDAANITLQFVSVSKASTLLCPDSLLSGWWDRVQGGNMIITEIIYIAGQLSHQRQDLEDDLARFDLCNIFFMLSEGNGIIVDLYL